MTTGVAGGITGVTAGSPPGVCRLTGVTGVSGSVVAECVGLVVSWPPPRALVRRVQDILIGRDRAVWIDRRRNGLLVRSVPANHGNRHNHLRIANAVGNPHALSTRIARHVDHLGSRLNYWNRHVVRTHRFKSSLRFSTPRAGISAGSHQAQNHLAVLHPIRQSRTVETVAASKYP